MPGKPEGTTSTFTVHNAIRPGTIMKQFGIVDRIATHKHKQQLQLGLKTQSVMKRNCCRGNNGVPKSRTFCR